MKYRGTKSYRAGNVLVTQWVVSKFKIHWSHRKWKTRYRPFIDIKSFKNQVHGFNTFLHLWSNSAAYALIWDQLGCSWTWTDNWYLVDHEPNWATRASISSCFLVPETRIPKVLQASFRTGTVSFAKVPFFTWALSSSSGTSTLGFFSAPPPASAIIKEEIENCRIVAKAWNVILTDFTEHLCSDLFCVWELVWCLGRSERGRPDL